MPQVDHVWTPDRVRALPDDGRRYEVVAGELLVTPAPSFRHQDAVFRLTRMLSDYVERTGVGYALPPGPV
jgi:Uma2 family endonuclease